MEWLQISLISDPDKLERVEGAGGRGGLFPRVRITGLFEIKTGTLPLFFSLFRSAESLIITPCLPVRNLHSCWWNISRSFPGGRPSMWLWGRGGMRCSWPLMVLKLSDLRGMRRDSMHA